MQNAVEQGSFIVIPDRASLARQLRVSRQEAGLTQARTADLLGRNRKTIIQIEKGASSPDFDLLLAMVSLYGQRLALAWKPRYGAPAGLPGLPEGAPDRPDTGDNTL